MASIFDNDYYGDIDSKEHWSEYIDISIAEERRIRDEFDDWLYDVACSLGLEPNEWDRDDWDTFREIIGI